MNSRTHLLRVEVLNFDRCVYDTPDVQTTRGASQLAAAMPTLVYREFTTALGQPIQLGSSTGLFALHASGDEAAALQKSIRAFLKEHEKLRHLSTAVEIESMQGEGDFARAEVAVMARVRRAQLGRVPSVTWAVHSVPDRPRMNGICAIDRVRPAIHQGYKGSEDAVGLSDSVHQRRSYGRHRTLKLLQEFAADHSLTRPQVESPADLEALGKAPTDLKVGNADNKIAIIYVDGNKFGRFRSDSLEDSQRFDEHMRSLRQKQLVELAKGLVDADGLLRLELLYCAGDEFMAVIPAWLATDFVQAFFKSCAGWSWTSKKGKEPLTHAMSLIIAHASSPLGELQSLARSLVDDVAKAATRDEDRIAWLLLESFDAVGAQVSEVIDQTTGLADPKKWALSPVAFTACVDRVRQRKTDPASDMMSSRRDSYERAYRLIQKRKGTAALTAQARPVSPSDKRRTAADASDDNNDILHEVTLWDFVFENTSRKEAA